MEDKLYYEKMNITTAAEVKEARDYAVEHNYRYYRAVTEKGAIFGWIDDKHTKAAEGQKWFENYNYKVPEINIEPNIHNENVLEKEATTEFKEPVNQVDNQTVNEDTADYKALYKEAALERKQYKDECLTVRAELNAIKKAFAVIAAEIEIARNTEV